MRDLGRTYFGELEGKHINVTGTLGTYGGHEVKLKIFPQITIEGPAVIEAAELSDKDGTKEPVVAGAKKSMVRGRVQD